MSDSSGILMVYMTASSREEADLIAEAIIKEKLAACVNILGGIDSMYEWEGRLERANEVALIAKTTSSGFAELEQRVKELHSYDCPCLVAWPIGKGHGPFLDWVRESTKRQG